jgi:hypothetical protein
MHFKIQKFTSQNLVYQAAVFCVRNAPKVTSERLRFQKFSGGYKPGPPLKRGEDMRRERRGGERREREGRGCREREGREERKEGRREESGAPSLQASALPLPLGWLRPCTCG